MAPHILISGGGGFLGVNLANRLIQQGHAVRVFDLRSRPHDLSPAADYVQGDVRNAHALDLACEGITIVYNLASLLPCSRAGKMFWHVNVGGTLNLLNAAMHSHIKRFIHLSSSIVYGIPHGICTEETTPYPIGDYGRSKLRAEKLCLDYFDRGLKGVILRPRFILGPGRLGLLTILFEWIHENKAIYTIGNGHNRFQMINVHDVIHACILAMKKGPSGMIFNLGSDNVPPVADILSALIRHAHSRSKLRAVNATLARTTLRILDYFKLTPLNVEHYLIADKDYVLDTSRAKRYLGWKPRYGQIESLIQSYDWYMHHRKILSSEIASDLPNQRFLRLIKLVS